jgi:hypothetical protein
MEQVAKVYGKFALEAVTAALLFVFLFAGITDTEGNHGVLRIIGAGLPVSDVDYGAYTDYGVWITEANREKPSIHVQWEGWIMRGNRRLSDYIWAEDDGGNRIPFRVTGIWNPSGQDVTADFDRETGIMDLKDAGIYTVKVSAMDEGNRKTVKRILLPVNR